MKNNEDMPEDTQTVNLLPISDDSISYYITIADTEKLISSDENKDGHRKFICSNCLQLCNKELIRDRHHSFCASNRDLNILMPRDYYIMKYTGFHRRVRHPLVIFTDTEVIQPRVPRYVSSTQTDVTTHIPLDYCCYTHYDHGPSTT